jgi:peptidyl-prolyl cis-trans isomerase C
VTVNGHSITEQNLEFLRLSRQIPIEEGQAARKALIEQLVDRQLVREFLDTRKEKADPGRLDDEIGRIERLIRRGGKEPAEVLGKLGYDDARLRDELSLGLTWQSYVRRILTEAQIADYFAKHREEFDGTEVRASQILIKLPPDAAETDVKQAEQKLKALRGEIEAGRLNFVEAARRNSQAASSESGGDVGYFPYRGRMPADFSRAAFGLRPGEISQPFRTRFGLHLCTVTDRKPGELSFEDARPEILQRLSDDRWQQVVRDQRKRRKSSGKIPPIVEAAGKVGRVRGIATSTSVIRPRSTFRGHKSCPVIRHTFGVVQIV